MSTTLNLLTRVFPQVRQMQRDTIRIKSEREEWRQRYTSLQARAAREGGPAIETVEPASLADLQPAQFPDSPGFRPAYEAALASAGATGCWEWRVRNALWAAGQAQALPGVFVSCEEHWSALSLAVLEFYAPFRQPFFLCQPASATGSGEKLARFPTAQLLRGSFPEVLIPLQYREVAFLSLELTQSREKLLAGEQLWPNFTPGGVLLLSDYARPGHDAEKAAWDRFAAERGVPILGLPTGQGLLIKR